MKNVLILEDDPLLASSMALVVEDSLDCHVCLAAGVSEAMPLIDDGLEFALLDVDVSDGQSFPLAALMMERKIPCLFVSGSDPSRVPSDLASIPFLRKPVPADMLITAMRERLS
jgi:DNA-binding NtrC family response regulator